jgi:hypothetical protein
MTEMGHGPTIRAMSVHGSSIFNNGRTSLLLSARDAIIELLKRSTQGSISSRWYRFVLVDRPPSSQTGASIVDVGCSCSTSIGLFFSASLISSISFGITSSFCRRSVAWSTRT